MEEGLSEGYTIVHAQQAARRRCQFQAPGSGRVRMRFLRRSRGEAALPGDARGPREARDIYEERRVLEMEHRLHGRLAASESQTWLNMLRLLSDKELSQLYVATGNGGGTAKHMYNVGRNTWLLEVLQTVVLKLLA